MPKPITKATVSPQVPTEVVDGDANPVPVEVTSLPIDFFDDFSWRSFLALNWPGQAGVRDQADAMKKVSDPGPRVWETWKADYEVFQPGGAPPTDWTSFDAVTPCSDIPFQGGGKSRLLAAFSKFGNLNEANFGLLPANPLVAQNQTYTRFEVRVNRLQYNFIRDNQLYLRAKLKALTQPLRFPTNSIEVKASWRELKDDEAAAAQARYYVIKARVQNPLNNDRCEGRTMALVGFHIVQKTPLRPQWVWSSFEHIDNVPEPMGVHAGMKYSYNDLAKPQALDPADPPPALSKTNPPVPNPKPMQVVRVLPVHPRTKATNARYQQALAGTIWANYQLVLTQWPTRTKDLSKPNPEDIPGDPFPPDANRTSVGNTTMETYFQDSASRMLCHDLARQRKTDFIWFVNLRAFPPDEATFRIIGDHLKEMRSKKSRMK